MQKNMKYRLSSFYAIFILSLFTLHNTSFAQLLEENFDYVAGTNLNGQGGWPAHNAAGTNPIRIASSGLTYPGYEASELGLAVTVDTSGEDNNKSFDVQTSGSVYGCFLVKVLKATHNGDYFFHFIPVPVPLNTAYRARVHVKRTVSGNLAFGITKGINVSVPIYSDSVYSLNTTYLIVVKYSLLSGSSTNDSVSLWLNPPIGGTEPLPSLSMVDILIPDIENVGAVALRQGTASTAARVIIDGIRVGTTWESVVSVTATPTITVTGGPLNFGSVTINETSSEQSYMVAGSNLTGNLDITAPTGFEVSSTSGSNFSSSLSLTSSGGSIPTTSVYVRFKPTSLQSYNGNIENVSSGAITQNVGVNGIGVGSTYIFHDDFNDGDFTNNPTWNLTPGGNSCWAPGLREVVNGEFHILQSGCEGAGRGTEIDYNLNIYLSDSTKIKFDIKPVFSSVPNGAGVSHEEYPAYVRLELRDTNDQILVLRFCYNDDGGSSLTTDTYIRVAFPYVPANVWQRDQVFRIKEFFPFATRISKIFIGGNGWQLEGFFDNISIYDVNQQQFGSISGIKFNDINGNGIKDQNEPVLNNWKINLSGTATDTILTNSNGYYSFDSLLAGTYTVSEEQQSGWIQTSTPGTYTIILQNGEIVTNNNFGNQTFPETPEISSPVDGAENQPAIMSFIWNPATGASSYHLQISTDSTFGSTFFNDSSIVSTTKQIDSLRSGTKYFWHVRARNAAGYSDWSTVWRFTTLRTPDLQVTVVNAPSTAWSGNNYSVTWTVFNKGTIATSTSAWYDGVYLSTSPTFDPLTATFLRSFLNLSYLNPNEWYTNTSTFTLPECISGNYYVFVVTDMYNNATEFNETNNRGRNPSAMVVTLSPIADLRVTSTITPSSTFSGDSINISWSVKNFGSGSTQTPPWTDAVYFSSDSIFSLPNSTLLSAFNRTGVLQPESIYTQTKKVKIPHAINGKFFLYVRTDNNNNVLECAGDNNNTRRSDSLIVNLTPPPDLQVTNIVNPSTVGSGQILNIQWTVKNLGAGSPFEPGWSDAVYVSKAPNFYPDSVIQLGVFPYSGALDPDSSYTKQQNLTIPNGFISSYYVYVKTDYNNLVFEHNLENNNTTRSTAAFQVQWFDLSAMQVTIPSTASPNQSVPINWTGKNLGPGSLLSRSWNDKIYLSKHSIFVPESCITLSTVNQSRTLLKDSSYNQPTDITIPNNISGLYYVYIQTNVNGSIPENGITGNNVVRSTGTMQITAVNLVVTNVSVPPTAGSGKSINITWTVKNNGLGAILNRSWEDRVFFSKLPTFSVDSSSVRGTSYQTRTLLSDSSYFVQQSILLPNGISGSYYIYVATDWHNSVFENIAENNNITRCSSPISVTLSPWPDLRVLSVQIPDSTVAGGQIPVSWSVKNSGYAQAPATWVDRIYGSTNSTWNEATVTHLQDFIRTQPLDTSSSYSANANITISTGWVGIYYIYVRTDVNNSVYEHSDENNNITRSSALSVRAYPPIDLVISNVAAPTSANAGNPITVGWVVQNIGSGRTLASNWNDAVYLSSDTILDIGGDLQITSVPRNGALNPGESYTRNQSTQIPNGVSGTYYLIVRTDVNNNVNDIDITNNAAYCQTAISIIQLPPPDLVINSLIAPLFSQIGQPISVQWTVLNIGVGSTTRTPWYDAVYFSDDSVLSNNDLRIGIYTRNSNLSPGGPYTTDPMLLDVPMVQTAGTYYLIVKTDSRNDIYEQTGENNNTKFQSLAISIPPPADLVVSNITLPSNAIPGEDVTVSWIIRNQGFNPVIGWMSDAVHFSSDTTWSIDDPIFGIYKRYVNLSPGSSMLVSMKVNLAQAFSSDSLGNITGKMPGVTIGQYHAIVRTDIRNNIYESDDLNNMLISDSAMNVDVQTILLATPVVSTFTEGQIRYYRVVVDSDLDLRLTLSSNVSNATNEVYVSYGQAPTLSNFDFSGTLPFSAKQEVLVPSTQAGSYYIMVLAKNLLVGITQITDTLFVRAIPFSVFSISPNSGGAGGLVTCDLIGGGFNDSSLVFLQISADTLREAEVIKVHNRTQMTIQIELSDITCGQYDILLVNPDSTLAILEDGFTVLPSFADVNITVRGPSAIRAGTIEKYRVIVSNLGNVDTDISIISINTFNSSLTLLKIMNHLGETLYLKGDSLLGLTPAIIVPNIPAGKDAQFEILVTTGTLQFQQLNQPFGTKVLPLLVVGVIIAVKAGAILSVKAGAVIVIKSVVIKVGASVVIKVAAKKAMVTVGKVIIETFTKDLIYKTLKNIQVPQCPDASNLGYVGDLIGNSFNETLTEWRNDLAGKSLSILVKKTACKLASALPRIGHYIDVGCDPGVFLGKSLHHIHEGNQLALQGSCWAQGELISMENYTKHIPIVLPFDPNEIIGPSGFDSEMWVRRIVKLTYTINFENDPTLATAPAREVTITQTLDSTINPNSFRLGSFGFGSFTFNPPANRSYYTQRLDVRDSLGVYVDVIAGLDVTNNTIFWNLRSIDPETGRPPTDPFVGFLPVNDSLNRGQGFVNYTVQAKNTTQSGQKIFAKAKIFFDYNDPIETNEWVNTVDAVAPTSQVTGAFSDLNTGSIRINWRGSDDPGGSGIHGYSLYAAVDSGAFSLYQSNIIDTTITYPADIGHSYKFFSIARDNAGNVESMKSAAEDSLAYGFAIVNLQVSHGWNMISLPVKVTNPRRIMLFPTSTSNAFAYNQSYQIRDTLENGFGYWLKFNSNETRSLSGVIINEDTIDVNQGWNMIGGISIPISKSSITTIPQNIITSQYYTYNNGYILADSVLPGKGYWVKVNQTGKLIQKKSVAQKTLLAKNNQLDDFNKLIITDASGNKQEIFFEIMKENIQIDMYALPPLPPTGIFDLRLASNSSMQVVENGKKVEIPILISSASYPLTVNWETKSSSLTAWLKIDSKDFLLTNKGSKQIFDPESKLSLKLDGVSYLPKEFSLSQNYPNPFNPITTIQYALPIAGRVNITIYNILGQRVETLIDEIQTEGYQKLQWNANNYASGIYFYRLEVNAINESRNIFSQVRKMLLLR